MMTSTIAAATNTPSPSSPPNLSPPDQINPTRVNPYASTLQSANHDSETPPTSESSSSLECLDIDNQKLEDTTQEITSTRKALAYSSLLLAASKRKLAERKEAMQQAFENLPKEIRKELSNNYYKKYEKDLFKAIENRRGRKQAFDFLSYTARKPWLHNIGDVWTKFYEILEDPKIHQCHEAIAKALMEFDETIRRNVLHYIFSLPVKNIEKIYNSEIEMAKDLLSRANMLDPSEEGQVKVPIFITVKKEGEPNHIAFTEPFGNMIHNHINILDDDSSASSSESN